MAAPELLQSLQLQKNVILTHQICDKSSFESGQFGNANCALHSPPCVGLQLLVQRTGRGLLSVPVELEAVFTDAKDFIVGVLMRTCGFALDFLTSGHSFW